MRSALALLTFAAAAVLLAVPPASATLDNPVCTPPQVADAQACVLVELTVDPLGHPQYHTVCGGVWHARGSAFACVIVTPDDYNHYNDLCITVLAGAPPTLPVISETPACLPY